MSGIINILFCLSACVALLVCSITNTNEASEISMTESETVRKEALIAGVNKAPQNSPSANPDFQEHPIPMQNGNFHEYFYRR